MPSVLVCWQGGRSCFRNKIDQIRFPNSSCECEIGLLEVTHIELQSIGIAGLVILSLNDIVHPMYHCLLGNMLLAPDKCRH